jgi:F420-dependent oxidoreductase-like protein
MKLSTLLPLASADPAAAAAHVADLERAGLDLVWVAEPYGFDAPTMLGYLAAVTSTVQLGAGILPIYSRTPALTAMTAAGLDRLSGGRAVLGLGASGPQVIEGWHGVPYDHPIGRTREVIDICRQVWRRERLSYHGTFYQVPLPASAGTGLGKPLKMIGEPVRADIPVYLAALGPKNVELAAEAAQGWLPLFYAPRLAHKVWGEALQAGLTRRPPELGELQICAGGIVAIGEDAAALRDLARPQLALYIGGMGAKGRNFYNDLVVKYGYEAEAAAIQDAYLDGRKDEAAALVPADLLEGTSLIGPRSYVAERVAAFRESGVTTINVAPIAATHAERVRLIEQIRELAA